MADWKVRVSRELERKLKPIVGRRKKQFVLTSLLEGVAQGKIQLPETAVPAASAPVVEG